VIGDEGEDGRGWEMRGEDRTGEKDR